MYAVWHQRRTNSPGVPATHQWCAIRQVFPWGTLPADWLLRHESHGHQPSRYSISAFMLLIQQTGKNSCSQPICSVSKASITVGKKVSKTWHDCWSQMEWLEYLGNCVRHFSRTNISKIYRERSKKCGGLYSLHTWGPLIQVGMGEWCHHLKFGMKSLNVSSILLTLFHQELRQFWKQKSPFL